MNFDLGFYKRKRILVTGHTGFKGTWLCKVLELADVVGYSLEPPTSPSLFEISGVDNSKNIKTIIGDIRDLSKLMKVFDDFQPEIVIHDGCYTTGNIVDLFCNSWNKMVDSSNNSFGKAS